MTGGVALRRLAKCLAMSSLLALAACGGGGDSGDQSAGTQQVAGGSGADGQLVSNAQAHQGAEQWFSDHEQALLKRDAKALARIDAEPLAGTDLELVRAALSTGRGIVAAARQPTALRVHVPAAEQWPVPVLAVYDLPGSNGATEHLAVLLAKLNPSAAFVATLSAGLDATEPSFDTDPAGYVRTAAGPPGALSGAFAGYMEAAVHGSTPPSRFPSPPAS